MKICENCKINYICRDKDLPYICPAARELQNLYQSNIKRLKIERLKAMKKMLSNYDSEVDNEIKLKAEQIIKREPELNFIKAFDIKIGYVRSFKNKASNGKPVYASCQKVNDVYSAYIPYDFIITVYSSNIILLNEHQIDILLLHELMHIDIGERGFCTKPHDVEDFDSIIAKYGLHWDNS